MLSRPGEVLAEVVDVAIAHRNERIASEIAVHQDANQVVRALDQRADTRLGGNRRTLLQWPLFGIMTQLQGVRPPASRSLATGVRPWPLVSVAGRRRCVRCGLGTNGATYCPSHQASVRSLQIDWQLRRRLAGICLKCGIPRQTGQRGGSGELHIGQSARWPSSRRRAHRGSTHDGGGQVRRRGSRVE